MKISVLCNCGPHGEDIPCAFHLGGRRLPVLIVLSRWSESEHRYYEVAVDDGRRFVLRHDMSSRAWELAAVYAASRPSPKAKAIKPVPKKAPATSSHRWWPFGH